MKRSVLIVESNRALQFLLKTLLDKKYSVKCVKNSKQAIQLFALNYETDLVILDMPGIESENFELMEHISTSSVFINTPVIVLSESNEEKLKNACLQIGASYFLTKPFNPVYLFEKANQLLSGNIPITKKDGFFI
jgi:CheY-like chemotaxis protein